MLPAQFQHQKIQGSKKAMSLSRRSRFSCQASYFSFSLAQRAKAPQTAKAQASYLPTKSQ